MVLCPVTRPVTALEWVMLKDRNVALAPRQGPEISSRACFWTSPRPRHRTQCWLTKPTTNPSSYILSKDSQGRLRSKKPKNRAAPCDLVGDLIASYSSMSKDPVQPHRMPGRDIGQERYSKFAQKTQAKCPFLLSDFNQNGFQWVYQALHYQISCLTYIILHTKLFHIVFNNYCSDMFRPQFLAIFRGHIIFLCVQLMCQLIWHMYYIYY
jgi:hypothetical protein